MCLHYSKETNKQQKKTLDTSTYTNNIKEFAQVTFEQELPSRSRVKQQQTASTIAPKVQPFWSPWQVEQSFGN